ncbi:MAG: hypothetical protein JNK29_08610, partial [Anaerolineales bacterium]|nr:hypothetical protein [Anaerolineales bacterium]
MFQTVFASLKKTPGRRPSRLASLLAMLVLIGMVLAAPAGPALAVHDDGVFQLDGDPLTGTAAGDDWNALFPVATSPRPLA